MLGGRGEEGGAPDLDVDRDKVGDDQLQQRVAGCFFRFFDFSFRFFVVGLVLSLEIAERREQGV